MYSNYQNFYRGVSTPSFKTNINPLSGKKESSFRTLISGAEKSIDTISSIIPLYQKVQPVLSQGKTILSSITSFFTKNRIKQEKKVEKVEVEIIDPSIKESNKSTFDYRTQDDQSHPFFNE